MFHRWISADDSDQCLGCGVITPDFGTGVISDHGPLPITCPGPGIDAVHVFEVAGQGIECAFCTETITDETLPGDVNWECATI